MFHTPLVRRRLLQVLGTVAITTAHLFGLSGEAIPTTQAATLPTPASLTVVQDDRVATLQWDGGPIAEGTSLPNGIAGYRIKWGPATEPTMYTKLTAERIAQLQPLENGKEYAATIEAVSTYGEVSARSTPIHFTGDPTRVEGLRARMNGFFDDFNLKLGAPDERKWNTAYARCNGTWANGFFINAQYHAHNSASTMNGLCDRGQNISRPRAELDLSDNGTRTIVFDLDGEFRRNFWYLDLVPGLVDITSHVALDGARGNPANGLRFIQNGQSVTIARFAADGSEVVVAKTDYTTWKPLDMLGVKLVPNVRRRWELKVSRTSAAVWIDGKKVVETAVGGFNLPLDRYTVLWNTFTYNTPKANAPYVLVHWDNFGFDAPVGSSRGTVTNNYKLNLNNSDAVNVTDSTPAKLTLRIPDQVSGASARRLLFTIQMWAYATYAWSANDAVTINGTRIAVPQPTASTTPPLTSDQLINVIAPYTVVLPIPDGVLNTGDNILVFNLKSAGVLNIHVELDYPAASAPSYTQPAQVIGTSALPTALPKVGPNGVITTIGATAVAAYISELNKPTVFNPTIGGVVPISVSFGSELVAQSTGENAGIVQVDLLVDRRVVQSVRTIGASSSPAVKHTFQLDTRTLKNGAHELMAVAYNGACTASIPEYNGAGAVSGSYFPLNVTVTGGRLIASGPLAEAFANPAAAQVRVFLPQVARDVVTASTSCNSAISVLATAGAALQEAVPELFPVVTPDATDPRNQFICMIQ